jgi:hypothetical protein
MFVYVKWNSFGCGFLANVGVIRTWSALRWPLPERRPAPPQAARLGRSVGSGMERLCAP